MNIENPDKSWKEFIEILEQANIETIDPHRSYVFTDNYKQLEHLKNTILKFNPKQREIFINMCKEVNRNEV